MTFAGWAAWEVVSPRALGSSGMFGERCINAPVFPACAGVNGNCSEFAGGTLGVPRIRGGERGFEWDAVELGACSPRGGG